MSHLEANNNWQTFLKSPAIWGIIRGMRIKKNEMRENDSQVKYYIIT